MWPLQHISEDACSNSVNKNLYLSLVYSFFVYCSTDADLLVCEGLLMINDFGVFRMSCWSVANLVLLVQLFCCYESKQSAFTNYYLILTQMYCKKIWKAMHNRVIMYSFSHSPLKTMLLLSDALVMHLLVFHLDQSFLYGLWS